MSKEMILKGSYCHEGVKGDKKAVYEVKFDSDLDALSHIQTVFTQAEIVEHFWYGYHINGVNKVAKTLKTAGAGYDRAEEILEKDFEGLVTFERDVEKVKAISAEDKEVLALFKGMSKAQVAEVIAKLQG